MIKKRGKTMKLKMDNFKGMKRIKTLKPAYERLSCVLFTVLFMLQIPAIAQQGVDREYIHMNHLWMDFDFEQKIAEKVKLGVDIPWRRQSLEEGSLKIYDRFHYFGFRLWTTINLAEDVDLSISPFAYIYSVSATNDYEELENWEEELRFTIRVRHAPVDAAVSHRYAAERRYFRNYEENQWSEFRFRYRLQFNREVFKYYSLIVNDEIFINMGNDISYNIFDMNRFFAGFRREVCPQVKITAGYRNILEQLPSGETFNMIHAMVFTLSINSTLSD